MLPGVNPASFASGAHSSTGFSMQAGNITFPGFPYATGTYAAGPLQNTLHGGAADPNSPELFRSNIQLAQEQVLRVHELAKRCLDGIQNAYSPGRTPMQTEADLAALKASLEMLAMHMRLSGVGALPLLLDPNAPPPTEDALAAMTERSSKTIFEENRRVQESANVVANRLVQR